MEKQNPLAIFFYPLGFLILMACVGALAGYPLFLMTEGSYPFEKVTSKLTLLLLIISIYPLSRQLDYTAGDLGLGGPKRAFYSKVISGFLAGLLILAIAIMLELYLQIRLFDEEIVFSITLALKLISKALLSGLLIAIIEETLFRGLLFRYIEKRSTAHLAIFLSAFFYAALHFLQPETAIEPSELNFLSGFKIVTYSFANLANPEIFDSLFALFLVGTLLAIVRKQTKSIAHCIGMHASWVFLLKVTKSITDSNGSSEWRFLIGSYDGIIGHLVSGWLFIIIALYLVYLRREANNP